MRALLGIMAKRNQSEHRTRRVRIPNPRENEKLAVVLEIFGGNRMLVQDEEGTEYTGVIRGKIKKRLWCRTGDKVLIIPWDFETSKKGKRPKAYIIWRYTSSQFNWLINKGIVKDNFDLDYI